MSVSGGDEHRTGRATRVLLVDDHASLREPLAFVFDREPDFEVAGQASSLAEASSMLQNIDLAILDLGLPDGWGTDIIQALREQSPRALALVLTGLSDPVELAMAVEAGAAGVLSKNTRIGEIIGAARRVVEGEHLLSPQEVLEAVRITSQWRREGAEARRKLERLTAREKEVLRVLADGLADKEIAERLHIGVGTVRTHVESILAKLEVESRLQAVVFAARHGAIKI